MSAKKQKYSQLNVSDQQRSSNFEKSSHSFSSIPSFRQLVPLSIIIVTGREIAVVCIELFILLISYIPMRPLPFSR